MTRLATTYSLPPKSTAQYKATEAAASKGATPAGVDWYDNTYGVWSRAERAEVISALRPTRDCCVLDVGCGVGRITFALAPRVFHVTATDISRDAVAALELGAANRGLRNVRAEACDLNALDDTLVFDGVTACQVIQHIPSDELRLDAVERIRRLLKPGGRFVSTHYRWGGMIDDIKEGEHTKSERYYFAFTAEELHDLLHRAGFHHIRVRGVAVTPTRLRSLADRLPALFAPLDRLAARTPVQRRGQYLLATGIA